MFAATQRFACDAQQSTYGPGDYWVRLTVPPQHGSDQLPVLLFIPNLQADAQLFVRDSSDTISRISLDNAELSRRTQIGARVEIELEPSHLTGRYLLIRIDQAINATGLLQSPQLLDLETAHRTSLGEMAIYAAFFGLCIALLFYNFALWVSLRERFQLIYCGSVITMMAYSFLHSGTFDWLFPAIGADTRFRLNYPALGLMAVFSIRFIVDFLPARAVPGWMRHIVNGCCGVIIVAAIAVLFAPIHAVHTFDRIYVASFLPIPLLAIVLGSMGWKHDREAVRLLVLAWSLPVLMAIVRLVHAANLIGFSSFVENSVVFAMSCEALFSSLAMALRVRHIVGERDLARAEEMAARRLSEIDSLTGLNNRRALLANAQNMAPGQTLRLLLVDIDFFKSINDTYGHEVGDEVLRDVAAVLARRLEIRGTAARLGGEEFALLGPASEVPEDLAMAILSDIRAAELPHGVRITASIGIAEGTVSSESEWRDLYRRADAALYDAKHSGRNCHVVGRAPRTRTALSANVAAA